MLDAKEDTGQFNNVKKKKNAKNPNLVNKLLELDYIFNQNYTDTSRGKLG